MRIAAALLIATTALGASPAAPQRAARPVLMKLTGTTPCGDAIRNFLGGLSPDAPCHAITWDLQLLSGGTPAWNVEATYNVPRSDNPNTITEGPRVNRSGSLEMVRADPGRPSAWVYRLRASGTAVLSLKAISEDVMHFLAADGRLLIGTEGWNYSLGAVEHAEPPVPVSYASATSYTIQPRARGDGVFAVYEGRTPCTRIAGELGITPGPGCNKIKWRVTLFQDPSSKAPTTFRTEGSLDRERPRSGTWRITQGTPSDPSAVVYELRSTERRPMLLLKGSDDVVFMLDSGRSPLVGNRDFSYTLNRGAAAK